MGNRIFVGVVVTLWAGTMSWLMMARILPPFFHGEPPTHGTLVHEPVCWEIQYCGRTVGHAVSQAIPGAVSTTEIHSRIKIDGIEVRELAPQWMGSIVRTLGAVSLDMRSLFVLDSLNNLSSFNTKVKLNDLPVIMRVRGKVEGAELKLTIQSGEVTHPTASYQIPSSSLLTSELVPDPKMLQVYVGRKWQQEVYSPFRSPGSSLEILEAEVTEERHIDHRGQQVNARKIEYRSLSAAGVTADNRLRAVIWVADDGTVLRQDVYLMDAKLRFERCTEPSMIKLAEKLLDINSVATVPLSQSSSAPKPLPDDRI
jgi:hypothetical protein